MNGSSKGSDDDVQITKVSPARPKKTMAWVSSSFDSFGPNVYSVPQMAPSSNKTSVSNKSGTSSGCQNSVRKTMSSSSKAVSKKRPRDDSQRNAVQHALFPNSSKSFQNTDLWADKYRPQSKADLAVHKKKVEEISEWLVKYSQYAKVCVSAPILLLTGPPGAGKTACVRVLCTELGFVMQEVSGTHDQAADQWISTENQSERSKVDTYQSQSQSSVFHNFLLRANKYRALDISDSSFKQRSGSVLDSNLSIGKKTVIVVEEMPNIFFRDSSQFHDILRKYKRCGKCPLIFILSDSNTNSSGIQKLFPKDLMYQLHIDSISMNPVAPTMLVKLLTKIANAEAGKCLVPSASVIETIAVSSGGDIRSALNSLQFACRRDTLDLGAKCAFSAKHLLKRQGSSSSGARLKYGSLKTGTCDGNSKEDLGLTLGLKDKAIFLFQSVGKILHFKRGNPTDHPRSPSLPSHLSHFDRDPLLVDPEDVAFKSQLSGDSLTSFLHENYVEFLSSVEDLERAAKYFSDADSLSALWAAREDLQNYSVSVALRGYIHSSSDVTRHDSTRRNLGWLPLHKSRWLSASKQAIENVTSARQLFKGYHWEPEVLCTEILPFLNLSNPTLHDPGQISFVQEMATFSRATQLSRLHLERLSEKDVVDDEEDDDKVTLNTKNMPQKDAIDAEDGTYLLGSQSQIQPLKKDENSSDEEAVIEEFEDEEDDFEDLMFS